MSREVWLTGAQRARIELLMPTSDGLPPSFGRWQTVWKRHRRFSGDGAYDKAYSSRTNRTLPRRRGIKAVIPEPSDQAQHRKRRGRTDGRLPRPKETRPRCTRP